MFTVLKVGAGEQTVKKHRHLAASVAEMNPQVQQDLQQLQQLSSQLQSTTQQRLQLEALRHETNDAVQALEALPEDAAVYRSLGALLVKDAGRDAALARLRDDLETLEVRVKRVKSQEEAIRKSAESLQKKLQAQLGKGG
jgi:prefoldin beta subunit